MKFINAPPIKALLLASGLLTGIALSAFGLYVLFRPNIWRTELPLRDFAIDPTSTFIATVEVTPGRESPNDSQFPPSLALARIVRLRDLTTGEVVRTFGPHRDDISSVTISPNGSLLASSSLDSMIKIWDMHTNDLLHTITFPDKRPPNTIRFSPNGQWLAVQVGNGVQIWSCDTWQLQSTLLDSRLFDWSSDSKLISGFGIGRETQLQQSDIHIWQSITGDVIESIPVGSTALTAARDARPSWSPDGRMIAVGDTDPSGTTIGAEVRIFDVSTQAVVTTLPSNAFLYDMGSIAWSNDGRLLAVSYKKFYGRFGNNAGFFKPEGIIDIWEVGDSTAPWKRLRRIRHSLEKRTAFAGTLQFTPDSTKLVFGSRFDAVQWWDLK